MRRSDGLAIVLLLVLASQTRAYVRVWQSNLTLWQHAVQETPFKPRPWTNYGVALAMEGHFSLADQAFARADAVADRPQVPVWDREETHRLMGLNRATLQRVLLVRR